MPPPPDDASPSAVAATAAAAGADPAGAEPTGAGSSPSRRRLLLVLSAPASALLLGELNQSVLATALPTVVGELEGLDRLLWVNTGYVLAGTVAMPVAGRLGDLLGRRPVFLVSVAVLLLGSVLGGLAPTMEWLIAARAVQGVGGGGLLVLVQALVADLVPVRRRAPVMSGVGAAFALGALLGPLLGGWLTETVGWRWAFWMNVPVGLFALVGSALLLPRGRPRRHGPLDVTGVVTLSLATTAAVLLVSGGTGGWAPGVVGLLLVAAVGGTVAFVLVERRATEPLIPLHLLTDRTVALAVAAGALVAVAMFGTISYLPTYLQMVGGLSPVRAGLVMLALVTGLGLATVVAAQVVARTGRARGLPVLGALLCATALALMAGLTPGSSLVLTGGYLFLLGVGIGCSWDVLVVLVQDAAPDREVGTVTAVNGFFREVGVLAGTAVVGSVFTARLQGQLAQRAPDVGAARLTPEQVAGLPPEVAGQVAAAYAGAFTPVFAGLVPVVLLGGVLLLMVRSGRLGATGRTGAPDRAAGRPADGSTR
ncbi:MFS transporter [Auraticoccus monumenti]|uniref:MFS transporter n=1 Tax=Auraticoccus monumenti TaxID=675864 RepID=UPI0012F7DECB|nr:MFS transporter [Auraticoccus monumenti]